MFGWLKKTASNADEALAQAKKEMTDTSGKIQQVLDESGKSVKVIINVVLIALGVSVLSNLVTIGLSLSKTKSPQLNRPQIVINRLYLGVPKEGNHE